MVDLPPSIDELNEYGKFSFLNEMHTMASQISAYIQDPSLQVLIKAAIESIEAERTAMRDYFTGQYQRPQSKQVVQLILRCSELYLDYGLWYDLCNAEVRLIENGNEDLLDNIKNCFHDSELTSRYCISSPIIELTLTRLQMMQFFDDKQRDIYKGPDPTARDPLSHFELALDDRPSEAQLLNSASIPDDFINPDTVIISDEDYLETRERYVWAVFKSFRFWGCLLSAVYYLIFCVVAIQGVTVEYTQMPWASALASGYGACMFVVEICSGRLFQIACWAPKSTIGCLYPGIEFYFVEYVASIIAAIILILCIILDKMANAPGVNVLIIHHFISVIVPFFFIPVFFKRYQRAERSFKWVRIKFFKSCWWTIVRIIFCVLLQPGINGVQTIIANSLRNKPKLKLFKKQKEIEIAP